MDGAEPKLFLKEGVRGGAGKILQEGKKGEYEHSHRGGME